MKIERLIITGQFQYFWLKTVERVDLSNHCAKCLIGHYENVPKRGELRNFQLNDAIYYMCGVTIPYVWSENFHLAFRPKKGATLRVKEHGVEVVISDAERLPISESYVDPNDPNINKKGYRTCRNWQFAHYFAKNLIEPENCVD